MYDRGCSLGLYKRVCMRGVVLWVCVYERGCSLGVYERVCMRGVVLWVCTRGCV